MLAETHPQEAARLRSLAYFGALSPSWDARLDDIVAFAARLCAAPVAMIGVIDTEQQINLAEQGLGLRSYGLENSICAHALFEDSLLEIPDTLEDPRSRDMAICCNAPNLRFYAGAVLRDDAGVPLGSLCVLDHTPRRLDATQREGLLVMARQVVSHLTLTRALQEAEALRLEADHRVKNSLQSVVSMLRLSARRHPTPDVTRILQDVGQGVQAVARLHEHLYRAGGRDGLPLAAYLTTLAKDLQHLAPGGVTVSAFAPPVTVPQDVMANIGVIVNEFTANAFKHGFAQRETGQVCVRMDIVGQGRMRLEAWDTGVGCAPHRLQAGSGLGQRVMHSAAAKLGGRLELTSGPGGTRLSVEFPAEVSAPLASTG